MTISCVFFLLLSTTTAVQQAVAFSSVGSSTSSLRISPASSLSSLSSSSSSSSSASLAIAGGSRRLTLAITKATPSQRTTPTTPTPRLFHGNYNRRGISLFLSSNENTEEDAIIHGSNDDDGSNDDNEISNITRDDEGNAITNNAIKTNANVTTEEEETLSLGMESGWARFGRSFLRSYSKPAASSSSSSSEEEILEQNSNRNETGGNDFIHNMVHDTSIFTPNGTEKEDATEGGRDIVIDVDASRVSDESQPSQRSNNNTTAIQIRNDGGSHDDDESRNAENNSKMAKELVRKAMSASVKGGKASFEGGKKLFQFGKKIRDERKANNDNDDGNNDNINSTSLASARREPNRIAAFGYDAASSNGSNGAGSSNANTTTTLDETPSNITIAPALPAPTTPTDERSNDATRAPLLHSLRSLRKKKRQPLHKPALHNIDDAFTTLESKDIDSTTRNKQRKWARRRKRTVVLLETTKNAVVLFVLTFLAGNIMNQFVDLDEDGSFEVHFGKVLSSSPSSPPVAALPSAVEGSPVPSASERGQSSTSSSSSSSSGSSGSSSYPPVGGRKKSSNINNNNNNNNKGRFFQTTIATPKQYYNVDRNNGGSVSSSRAHALGLVSQAVQRVGPAVVRVETETYSDANNNNNNNNNSNNNNNGAHDKGNQKGHKSKSKNNERHNNKNGNNNGDLANEGEDGGDVFDGIPEAPSAPPAPPNNNNNNNDDSSSARIDFGQGSGMIVNTEGYVLTNAHVVEGATKIYVHLTDGRRFRAEMRGSDDIVDVAVLRIVPDDDDGDATDATMEEHERHMSNLPVARLGDSDRMEVGQFVTAIGSPGGLDNTCTIGIVSGLKRCPKVVGIPDKLGVLDYIQTDAAINQGNSGGPLVDVESGNIVGINTCIRANMEGTSFAIPINKVMGIVDDLSEGKHITHGYLGVHMSTMNPTLARYSNKLQLQKNRRKIPEKEGVMIEKVFKNSPAQEGGLKHLQGTPINFSSRKIGGKYQRKKG
eukprot:CAMPEP_0201681376 /NCGR_PEP_ID=MMETSP0494-20130426/51079_1 /ASSEMBLY_ACC=CAM_ASM_000839 /TAXON_ID=420259 /ORGANISM="Thalassiosira gravida, Strain GMp14c1" /LENGTH=997 /DNA_ID=CAMNT_0048165117 /DNA_START=15 /DNA_END=3008 /DNA_ORIENTATION=-